MKLAVVCVSEVHVPPRGYGGAERITDAFVWELTQNRGIEVDLYAACDSECPVARLVTTGERKLASDKKFLALLRKRRADFGPYDCVIDAGGEHLVGQQSDFKVLTRMGGDPFKLFAHDACRNRVYNSPEFASFYGCPNHPVLRNLVCREPEKLPLGPGTGGYALYVGVLHPMKGLLIAAEACKCLGLRFVAYGPKRPAYAWLWEELETRGVELPGELMSDEVQRAEVFGNASVFLHLVQCIDADPIAPKEAMLYGTPVVAAKRGGIASIVEPGFNGFFASNVKEAVESIPRALRLDRTLVRESILPQVNVQRYCDKLLSLCQRVSEGEEW
jgi:glycosyltransferase involved in cell wall biosynthesis